MGTELLERKNAEQKEEPREKEEWVGGMIWETKRDRRCKKKLNFNNHA